MHKLINKGESHGREFPEVSKEGRKESESNSCSFWVPIPVSMGFGPSPGPALPLPGFTSLWPTVSSPLPVLLTIQGAWHYPVQGLGQTGTHGRQVGPGQE